MDPCLWEPSAAANWPRPAIPSEEVSEPSRSLMCWRLGQAKGTDVRATIARTPDRLACPEGQFGCDDQESAGEAAVLVRAGRERA